MDIVGPKKRERSRVAVRVPDCRRLPSVGGSAGSDDLAVHVDYFSPGEVSIGVTRQRLADRSHSHPLAAVELHCIDCCGWERTEAARCEVRQCTLWALNLRIFGAGARRTRPREEKREG